MDVGPLVVHVLDAVLGLIVLHPRPGVLAAAPIRFSAGESLARRRLPQHPPIEFPAETVVVATVTAGLTIGRQLSEARPKTRIDVQLQHLGGRVDMSIGIVNPEAVLHADSPSSCLLRTPQSGSSG